MQTSNRILDDLAKVAGGAASTIAGVKSEAENLIRQQLQRLLADADLVSREEFEVVKALATKARTEQEKLTARVKKLEAKLVAKKPAAKKSKPAKAKKTKKA
ncbi:MAG: accessory factor UbiK family protein [Rhodospirillaceae bacterium]|jgi:BMFP domain-containing protein YqiC|nr:accessory factor UbiK family protein [Rhodospirillaceae bacterium]MBT5243563.1 accessory factor UbiK family protein [Rhodospirillaceae bacterium]MBT5562151.1 accessory factor UbiK family protein [Rhodospirillaceae bacterium]MBT6242324.1 accessory factor UbiK family protein [Rhodospirillaceae bacterium]MBT7138970.1 accessory factor UbiK family protein [Rhodospirillaceae bacterium]